MLCMGVGAFFAPTQLAHADTPTHTVTFKKGSEVIATLTVEEGESITEADIPSTLTHPAQLPELAKNKYYKWFYSTNDVNYFAVNITNDLTKEVITDIKSDIIFRVNVITKTSDFHEVTFILPNGAKVTSKVADGEDVEEPIVDLGFCERADYDKSLLSIREDTVITVTIDYTYKYIFVGGCLAVLIVSLVVIVVIIFRVLRVPDDEDEEFNEELTENTLKD